MEKPGIGAAKNNYGVHTMRLCAGLEGVEIATRCPNFASAA
jgi:hypothetical protein